ncbi:hypothetical protein HNY73_017513 [Argiope bruennichi]|uniref:Uncharacterized protein n=1 Tax=Argiope bruennichi TaxID=94029 RepID=A0A8T0E9X2_ARGBR|nr:hypothetical protein HNY73_017513 [Argiope bruennichi]
MALKVLALAAMAVTLVQAEISEGGIIQARGMDEGPWSMMNQQPEVLIVKEKGGAAAHGGTMGMSMKDLTPIICLLAPLLLAAIMIPAKMTMMMNNMMGNGLGGMFPMLPMIPMFPNGMLPMLPNGMLPGLPGLPGVPMSALLTGGSSSLQLPIFKEGIVSKEFTGKEFVGGKNLNDTMDRYDDCKKKESCQKGPLKLLLSGKEALLKRRLQTSEDHLREASDWSSRVWSDNKNKKSLANEILRLIERIEKALQEYE